MLPLSKQNTYRERYAALKPGWRTSGAEFEALTRSYIGPPARVLDLGCGRGGVMELFWREVKLAVGLDPDLDSLTEHRAQHGQRVIARGEAPKQASPVETASPLSETRNDMSGMSLACGRGDALPFPAASFDLVIGLWLLEHLAQPERVLSEINRVLAPGGRFIFLTPNALHPILGANRLSQTLPALQRRLVPALYGRVEADTFRVHYRANTPARLRQLAAAHGFTVASLCAIPDPTYLAFNDFLFQLSVLLEQVLPEEWGVHVVGDFARI